MKAFVIKTLDGYFGRYWKDGCPLNAAQLFSSSEKAEHEAVDGEEVIPVEIKILKKGNKNE